MNCHFHPGDTAVIKCERCGKDICPHCIIPWGYMKEKKVMYENICPDCTAKAIETCLELRKQFKIRIILGIILGLLILIKCSLEFGIYGFFLGLILSFVIGAIPMSHLILNYEETSSNIRNTHKKSLFTRIFYYVIASVVSIPLILDIFRSKKILEENIRDYEKWKDPNSYKEWKKILNEEENKEI
jgi:hypothetical protein